MNFDFTNGDGPYAGLVQGFDGRLYGTTQFGAANFGGTVFKITPTGSLTAIYSFCLQPNCSDGNQPAGRLLQATDGNLYGTTLYGGANYENRTVFRITPTGTLTTLYSFCAQSNCTDGYNPYAGLVQGVDGDFYGTTAFGRTNFSGGTVFKLTPGGTLTTLHSFCVSTCLDGESPYAGLVQASDGNFYGTTVGGGAYGYGTIFQITPAGTLTTVHSFDLYPDGAYPYAPVVQATDGNFYGTASSDGTYNEGTVFRMTPAGKLTVLHSFDSTDGANPHAGLFQATDGNFYGTTEAGAPYGDGTVFEIAPDGTLTTLQSFHQVDGAMPFGALVQATSGNLYGTTEFGGTNQICGTDGCGTVFGLLIGLGPFVETLPTKGKIGAVVKILGTNLKGAISVTFNGTPATFKVVSSSLISTTVPSSATTGSVQVVTPGGTLTSNVNFRVQP